MYKHVIIFVASISTFCEFSTIAAPKNAVTDYSKIICDDGKQHTMHLFTSPGPSKNCNKVIKVGLSEEEKRKVIDVHNAFRKKVASGLESRGAPGPQPAAKKMPNLEWDDELALIAQRWANQCIYDHDCSDVERFSVGQNIAEVSGEEVDIESLVQDWYDEVENFNSNEVSSYNPPDESEEDDISHYIQLVWAKTTLIGCGSIVYIHEEDGITTSLVCNYGPSGNVEGKPIYEKK